MSGGDKSNDDGRDPVVSFRAPQPLVDAVHELADEADVSPSRMWRMLAWHGVEANTETLVLAAEIDKEREEIKQRFKPIDQAGGFAGRVREDFEERFKNGYAPKWLDAKAESYREEARMLEEKVRDHPDAPEIAEGELVEEVERELADALEAMDLSNWTERHANRYEKFGGVEDAKDRRQFYVAAVQGAMRVREKVAAAFSSVEGVDVSGDDLSKLMEEDLPHGVDRDDVAEAANQLARMGVERDEVPEALREFDPRVWDDEDTEDGPGSVEDGPDPATDGGGPPVEADGGTERTPADLLEWAASELIDGKRSGTNRTLETAENRVETTLTTDSTNWQKETMDRTDLTPTDLVELADDYSDAQLAALNGERDRPENPLADDEAGELEVEA